MQRGELTARVLRSNSRQLDDEVVTSQSVAYLRADGTKVALVHQYLRRDGSLAASGLPDPKYLLVEGIEYAWNGE
jgi:hypothetical protein